MSVRARLVMLWLLLVAATVLSVCLFEVSQVRSSVRFAGCAVIAIAFVKVRYIGLDFMELRQAPRPMRIVFELWLLCIAGALIGMYWVQSVRGA